MHTLSDIQIKKTEVNCTLLSIRIEYYIETLACRHQGTQLGVYGI